MKRYILEVEVDEHGECFITLPDEMLDETGWDVGTMLEWEEETDGSIVLHQINESRWKKTASLNLRVNPKWLHGLSSNSVKD